jgi:hypothetical protein
MELFWWCGIFWFRLWNSSDGVVFSGLDYGTLLMVENTTPAEEFHNLNQKIPHHQKSSII